MGTSIATTQHAATSAAAVRPAPRDRARPRSQADAQIAQRISPGSTSGTRRRLAHGWSGRVSGCHKTAAEPQPMTASGSAQMRAVPDGSRQENRARRHRRTSSARPNPPSSSVGSPMYQMTQYRVSSAYSRPGSTGRCSRRCRPAT